MISTDFGAIFIFPRVKTIELAINKRRIFRQEQGLASLVGQHDVAYRGW